MKLLSMDTDAEEVLKEFPMLEGLSTFELTMMRSESLDVEEDAPFVRAIDILFKRIEEGSYHAPSEEEDE